MIKLSDERIRIGELCNALHEATELLDYYTRKIYNGEMKYHKQQVNMFKKILCGGEKEFNKNYKKTITAQDGENERTHQS